MAKITLTVKDEFIDKVKEYCELNGLKINAYLVELLEKEFLVDKYGDAPPFFKKKEIENIPVETSVVNVKVNTDIESITQAVTLTDEGKVEIEPETPKNEEPKIEAEPQKKINPKKEQARKRIEYL